LFPEAGMHSRCEPVRRLTVGVVIFLATVTAGLVPLSHTGSAHAEERFLDFVRGLRERDYFDLTLIYLDKLEQRADVPDDVKQVLDYERAVTLLDSVKAERVPDKQSALLDKARGVLEKFLKEHNDHPLAAQASAELANVYLGKARVEILQSRNPSNAGQKPQFQAKARDYLSQTRKVYSDAKTKYEGIYKTFPTFIDPEKDKKQYEERESALVNSIQAQLNLAITTYEEAQTYDRADPKFSESLTTAANEFELINQRYRSQVAGLYGRMWQGKCFEENGDVTKALGLYDELLGHPGDSPVMKRLQNKVLHFKLVCLNTDQRKDYQLVINLAQEWLKENTRMQRSREGLGIRWEASRACESLGDKESTEPSEKDKLYRQSLTYAQYINQFAGEYKETSLAAMQRLNAKLNRDGDPQDFATAFGLAKSLVKQADSKNKEVRDLTGDAKAKGEADLAKARGEAVRIVKLALGLWTPKEDINELNRARYFLAYLYFLSRDRNDEAMVLGEFVARKYNQENPDLALDCAFMAMYSAQQAFQSAPDPAKEFYVRKLVSIGDYISQTWPTSDKANDARITLGQMFVRLKKPVDAFQILKQVPETAPQSLEAQLMAGMAYWQAYIEESVKPEAERPPKETLVQYQTEATTILTAAIAKAEAKVPAADPAPDNVSLAKSNLVQILNMVGKYADALKYLTEGPKALVTAVTVPDEAQRPARGLKSRPIAEHVYSELLRSYVGLQQLEKARATMKDLEKVAAAGGGGTQKVIEIYLDLGRQLKQEVEQLRASGDARLTQVLQSFETFLNDIFQRKEGQDYNTLAWVGETYFALGDGMISGPNASQDDKVRGNDYFNRSATAFTEILTRAAADDKFMPLGNETGIQLRMVTCKRRQGLYEEAIELVRKVLTAKPKAIDAQVEAALTYEDWAATGQPDKWLLAISGDQPPAPPKAAKKGKKSKPAPEAEAAPKQIWGWQDLAERVGLNLMVGPASPEYEKQYLEAQYHVVNCRFAYAKTESGKKKEDALDQAKRDIAVTAGTSDLADEEWFGKFNAVYRQIQEEQIREGLKSNGEVVTDVKDLERQRKMATADKPKPKVASVAKKSAKAGAKPKAAESNDLLNYGLGAGLLVVAGLGVFFLTGKKKKPSIPTPELAATAPKAPRAPAEGAVAVKRKAPPKPKE
jgi:cellulose synthase operon protein C